MLDRVFQTIQCHTTSINLGSSTLKGSVVGFF